MRTSTTEAVDSSTSKPLDWTAFRRQMPVARRWAYLDHAAVAPLTGSAKKALKNWAQDAAADGAVFYQHWTGQLEVLRNCSARMINAEPEEIALVHNTTGGINLVAEGFPWQPGDNVVFREDEFPSNQYPWLQLAERGVETRRLACPEGRLDLDHLAQAIDHRTRLVSISWVTYAHGFRHALDEVVRLVHQRGALLFVDAIQGLGVFPLDVKKTPIDFLAADGHKWLLGPEGAGIFYLRREHLSRLRPMGVGWNSVKHALDFHRIELDLKDTAGRYEGGSHNLPGFLALGASLKLLAQYPTAALAERILELTDLACRRLEQLGAVIHSDRRPAHKSGIVAFELPGRDAEALRRHCHQCDVILSCRAGRLRISPHAYNDPSDIDRLMEALA